MARRARRLAITALVGSLAGLAVVAVVRSRRAAPPPDESTGGERSLRPEPTPAEGSAWREPVDGGCPPGFPVKVSQSGIVHVAGGRSYDRTTPERCYATVADAEADGYRRAKA